MFRPNAKTKTDAECIGFSFWSDSVPCAHRASSQWAHLLEAARRKCGTSCKIENQGCRVEHPAAQISRFCAAIKQRSCDQTQKQKPMRNASVFLFGRRYFIQIIIKVAPPFLRVSPVPVPPVRAPTLTGDTFGARALRTFHWLCHLSAHFGDSLRNQVRADCVRLLALGTQILAALRLATSNKYYVASAGLRAISRSRVQGGAPCRSVLKLSLPCGSRLPEQLSG